MYNWVGSPFRAGVQCAALRSTAPDNPLMVERCANARTVTGLWLGCAASVVLLLYRGFIIQRDHEKENPAPYSITVALLPFFLALLYGAVGPTLMHIQYAADSAEYQASKMTATEWVTARLNDERTSRSTLTSILCACIIAGAGVYNVRWSVSQTLKKT